MKLEDQRDFTSNDVIIPGVVRAELLHGSRSEKNQKEIHDKWSSKAKALIGRTIKERDKAIDEGYRSFSDDYIKTFDEEFNEYLSDGWKENKAEPNNYGAKNEGTLLRRLEKYHDNYFTCMKDFSPPTTNNLSERALRGIKSHEKISGQFESVETARYYAIIKTYTEGLSAGTPLVYLGCNFP